MKRILIVDDSPAIRLQVRTALGEGGFEVCEAEDGVAALEALAATPDVDAILCDVNMPRMGGLQLLDRLHQDGVTTRVPVVMLTTEGQPALMQQAKAAGAKGWIVKPFKPPLLLATLQKLTGGAR